MVQILPPATNLGAEIGQATGKGLSQGLQRGSEIGFQRNLLQDSLKNLDLQKNATPFDLAKGLINATAGIPGSERYVGQLFPLLLQQMQSQAAFPPGQEGLPMNQEQTMQGQGFGSSAGVPAQSLKPQGSSKAGGLLGNPIDQETINQRATEYAQRTGTGIDGYTKMQTALLNQNKIAQSQRDELEKRAKGIGVTDAELPQFMQLAQRHKNAKNFEELTRNSEVDWKEFKNLTKSLEDFSYPELIRGATLGPTIREKRLKKLDNTVKRLTGLGFEQEVRQTLKSKGLSDTEVEERIHPMTEETINKIRRLPMHGPRFQSANSILKKEDQVLDFLKNNITPDTSLLSLRNKLYFDRNYDNDQLVRLFNEAVNDPKVAKNLTTAQKNELGIMETQAPKQGLGSIFEDWGRILDTISGKK